MANTLNLKATPASIGDNVLAAQTEDGKLVLIIDPTQDFGRSSSGKTIVIATTRGNQSVGKAKVGLNVYRYPEKGE